MWCRRLGDGHLLVAALIGEGVVDDLDCGLRQRAACGDGRQRGVLDRGKLPGHECQPLPGDRLRGGERRAGRPVDACEVDGVAAGRRWCVAHGGGDGFEEGALRRAARRLGTREIPPAPAGDAQRVVDGDPGLLQTGASGGDGGGDRGGGAVAEQQRPAGARPVEVTGETVHRGRGSAVVRFLAEAEVTDGHDRLVAQSDGHDPAGGPEFEQMRHSGQHLGGIAESLGFSM